MFDAFAAFPDTARLWLMAFPRPLDEGEKAKLAEGLEASSHPVFAPVRVSMCHQDPSVSEPVARK